MTIHPDNEGRRAQRIDVGGDAWRCSLCDGYVRGNAPLCKHCHARFGPSEPVPQSMSDDTSSRRHSALIDIFAVGLWIAIGILVFVSWHVGILLGDIAGSMAGPLLFVTLATPIYAMWVYTAHRLPEPTLRSFAIDLVGVWTIFSLCIAVPLIMLLMISRTNDGWLSDAMSLAIFSVLWLTSLYSIQNLRHTFDGTLSNRACALFELKDPHAPFLCKFGEAFVFVLIPWCLYFYLRTVLPPPFSSFTLLVLLLWGVIINTEPVRERIRKAFARLVQCSLRRRS